MAYKWVVREIALVLHSIKETPSGSFANMGDSDVRRGNRRSSWAVSVPIHVFSGCNFRDVMVKI